MPELDDATTAYILETRKAFEDLRQVAAQLAGLLVLEAAGAREVPDHPMMAAAEELYREALASVQRARVTQRSRRHHDHLVEATAALRRALSSAQQSRDIDPVLIPLRAAYGHLQGAGGELPGFEMVAFAHGCCAVPARSAR